MSDTILCVYSNAEHNVLLYSNKTNENIQDIERVIRSPKWKEMNSRSLRIECDFRTQIYSRTIEKYIYFVLCDNTYQNSKINALIDEVNDFTIKCAVLNFNAYTKVYEQMIEAFVKEQNLINHVHEQIHDISNSITNAISISIERQDKINNLEQKAFDLRDGAIRFKKSAIVLKRNMQCRNVKTILMIVFFVLLAIGIIALIVVKSRA